MVTLERLNQLTGLTFSQNVYMYLQTAALFAVKKYGNKNGSNGTSITLEAFLNRIKKGSGKFRKILERKHLTSYNIEKLRVVKTFFDLVDCPVPEISGIKALHGMWGIGNLPNRIRMFSFQLFNNSISVGARTAARYRNAGHVIDQRCAFCVKSGRENPHREDFRHLFVDCPAIEPVINSYFEKMFGRRYDKNSAIDRQLKLTGLEANAPKLRSFFTRIHMLFLNFVIWQQKLKKVIPSLSTLTLEIDTLFENFVLCKKNRELALISDSAVCRQWRELQHGRG